MNYTIEIGGGAGRQVHTIGSALSLLLIRMGYRVRSDYGSRPLSSGWHTYSTIDFSDEETRTSGKKVKITIALDAVTVRMHENDPGQTNIVVYDAQSIGRHLAGLQYLHVPFEKIALEHGGDKILSALAAIGAVSGMMALDTTLLRLTIHKYFDSQPNAMSRNVIVAKAGYDYAQTACSELGIPSPKFNYVQTPHMIEISKTSVGNYA